MKNWIFYAIKSSQSGSAGLNLTIFLALPSFLSYVFCNLQQSEYFAICPVPYISYVTHRCECSQRVPHPRRFAPQSGAAGGGLSELGILVPLGDSYLTFRDSVI